MQQQSSHIVADEYQHQVIGLNAIGCVRVTASDTAVSADSTSPAAVLSIRSVEEATFWAASRTQEGQWPV